MVAGILGDVRRLEAKVASGAGVARWIWLWRDETDDCLDPSHGGVS